MLGKRHPGGPPAQRVGTTCEWLGRERRGQHGQQHEVECEASDRGILSGPAPCCDALHEAGVCGGVECALLWKEVKLGTSSEPKAVVTAGFAGEERGTDDCICAVIR